MGLHIEQTENQTSRASYLDAIKSNIIIYISSNQKSRHHEVHTEHSDTQTSAIYRAARRSLIVSYKSRRHKIKHPQLQLHFQMPVNQTFSATHLDARKSDIISYASNSQKMKHHELHI